MVDEALVLWMPAPASFTGEDCAELHLHGGRATVEAVSELLLGAGVRVAGPGEFTRRAFEHGRFDLVQAEAIADLVDAESGAQRRQAMGQLGGALSRRYEAWCEALLDGLALLEAEIDFPEEDVPDRIGIAARPVLLQVRSDLQAAVTDLRGERIREGFRVAIIGAPNVGKSSLLNALAGRDAAIVTPIAGTTRDIVEVPVSLAGQTLVLADTAGLRSTQDIIEAEGIRRAEAWAAAAHLRLGVVDLTRPETLASVAQALSGEDLLVLNKTDLAPGAAAAMDGGVIATLSVAVTSGDVGEIRDAIASWLARNTEAIEFPAATRTRHRALLGRALEHLERGLDDLPFGAELAAEGVRMALRALEQITGRSDPEGVLDRVFSSFCIGK